MDWALPMVRTLRLPQRIKINDAYPMHTEFNINLDRLTRCTCLIASHPPWHTNRPSLFVDTVTDIEKLYFMRVSWSNSPQYCTDASKSTPPTPVTIASSPPAPPCRHAVGRHSRRLGLSLKAGARDQEAPSHRICVHSVLLACGKIDKYRREVCVIYIDGRDVNLAQIEAGMAWWYKQYKREQTAQQRTGYEAAENLARAQRVGLWSDVEPVPPLEFRRAK